MLERDRPVPQKRKDICLQSACEETTNSIPDCRWPFELSAVARREKTIGITEKYYFGSFWTWITHSLLEWKASTETETSFDYTQMFVLASSGEQRTGTIESDRLNGIRMATIDLNRLCSFDIPENHLMIEPGTENEILHCWMAFDVIHSSLMTMDIDLPLIGIRFLAISRDGPDLDCSIIGTRGNLVVVGRFGEKRIIETREETAEHWCDSFFKLFQTKFSLLQNGLKAVSR